MRISDCAELTGTTVRTIRYYHQIGLLPIPGHRGGRRDYGLDHVARILRIRWLADAGVPLDAVAQILASDEATETDGGGERTLRELRATARTLDERLAELTEQRERIDALMTMAEEGREFSPLPPSFSAFYDRVTARLTDPDAIAALEKERRIGEMFAQRGMLASPAQLAPVMERLTEHDVDRVVEFYTAYARIPREDPETADGLVTELRELIRRWSRENPALTADTVALLPAWALRSRTGVRILQGFMTLVAGDARQARLLRGVLDDLLGPASSSANPAIDTATDTATDTESGSLS